MASAGKSNLNPIFNLGSSKLSSNLEKPFLDPVVERIDPTVAYDSSRSQTLTFAHTVSSAQFFHFSLPSFFMEYSVEKEVESGGTKTWEPVAETDRVFFDSPFSIIRSVRMNLNSVSLPLNLPMDHSLSRLIALAMRTSSPEVAPDLEDLKELMFLPSLKSDVSKTATDKGSMLEKFIAMSSQQGQGSIIVPIFLPFWPFGTMPLLSKLKKALPEQERNRVFPEHTQLSINVRVRAASDLSKYVRQLKGDTEANRLKLRVNVKDLFFLGETYNFAQSSTFMREYRAFSKKNHIKFPITLPTDIESELVSGLKETFFRVNVDSFRSRYLILFFKTKTQDEGSTTSHINVTDFAFPSGLKKLHIYVQEDSLANTPVEDPQTYFPSASKYPFFLKQVKNLRQRPTMREYFTHPFQNFIVMDMKNINEKYKVKLKTFTPELTVRLTWDVNGSPESTFICLYSFSEQRIEADMASPSGGGVAIV